MTSRGERLAEFRRQRLVRGSDGDASSPTLLPAAPPSAGGGASSAARRAKDPPLFRVQSGAAVPVSTPGGGARATSAGYGSVQRAAAAPVAAPRSTLLPPPPPQFVSRTPAVVPLPYSQRGIEQQPLPPPPPPPPLQQHQHQHQHHQHHQPLPSSAVQHGRSVYPAPPAVSTGTACGTTKRGAVDEAREMVSDSPSGTISARRESLERAGLSRIGSAAGTAPPQERGGTAAAGAPEAGAGAGSSGSTQSSSRRLSLRQAGLKHMVHSDVHPAADGGGPGPPARGAGSDKDDGEGNTTGPGRKKNKHWRKLSGSLAGGSLTAVLAVQGLKNTGAQPDLNLSPDEKGEGAALRFGDVVLLSAVAPGKPIDGSYIQSEGFRDERVSLVLQPLGGGMMRPDPLVDIRECLFRVVPQLQYTARKALQKFTLADTADRFRSDGGADTDKSAAAAAAAAGRKVTGSHESKLSYLAEKVQREQTKNMGLLLAYGSGSDLGPGSGQGSQAGHKMGPADLVLYGSVVQLQHVKSGKFLVSVPRAPAVVEKDTGCMRIALDANGSDGAWFKFQPRFKIKSEGGGVNMGDQVTLVSEKGSMFLQSNSNAKATYTHIRTGGRGSDGSARGVGAIAMKPPLCNEVNLCSKPTGWRLQCFTQHITSMNQHLLVGQCIRLYHPEAESYVSATTNSFTTKPPYFMHRRHRSSEAIYTGGSGAGGAGAGNGGAGSKSSSSNDDSKATEADSGRGLATKHLFIIEAPSAKEGGPVRWNGRYRLRHMPTGKFLAVVPVAQSLVEEPSEQVQLGQRRRAPTRAMISSAGNFFEATLLSEEELRRADEHSLDSAQGADMSESSDVGFASTLFAFHPTEKVDERDRGCVPLNDLQIRLEHTFARPVSNYGAVGSAREVISSCWLHSTGTPKPSSTAGACALGTKRRRPNKNTRLMFCSECMDQDACSVICVSNDEIHGVDEMLSLHPVLGSFVRKVLDLKALHSRGFAALGSSSQSKLPPPVIPNTEIDGLTAALERLIFAQCKTEDTDALTCEGIMQKRQQRLARELKIIDALFWVLSVTTEALAARQPPICSEASVQPVVNAVRLLYKAITCSYKANRSNELYVAGQTFSSWWIGGPERSFLRELIEQLGTKARDYGAPDCLTNLLTNNLELLEEEVDDEVVSIFVELIRRNGPVQLYLNFLEHLSSCEGQSVCSNQELLLRVMYSGAGSRTPRYLYNRLQLTIETTLDDSKAVENPSMMAGLGEDGAFLSCDEVCSVKASDLSKRREIVISWYGSPDWAPGGGPQSRDDPHFFYSPDALGSQLGLGLRTRTVRTPEGLAKYLKSVGEPPVRDTWVRLEEIAWTQDPEKLYAIVHDRPNPPTWREYREQMKSVRWMEAVYDKKKALADFYLTLVKLYSEMCLDRSYNCIAALEQHFSHGLCVTAIANPRLPDQLRAVFATLLCRLYIDRFPHEPVQTPEMVRVYDRLQHMDVTKEPGKRVYHVVYADGRDALPQFKVEENNPLRQDPMPFYRFPDAKKFKLVKDFIAGWFETIGGVQVADDRENNMFALSLLRCLKSLVFFGFYGTVQEIWDLVQPMIPTLDGRTDAITQREGIANTADMQERRNRRFDDVDTVPATAAAAGTRGSAVVAHGSPTRVPPSPGPRSPGRGAKFELLGSGADHVDSRSGDIELTVAARSGPARLEGKTSDRNAAVGLPARMKTSYNTTLIMEAKQNMCEVLCMVCDLRLDYRLSQVLFLFRQQRTDPDVKPLWRRTDEPASESDEDDEDRVNEELRADDSSDEDDEDFKEQRKQRLAELRMQQALKKETEGSDMPTSPLKRKILRFLDGTPAMAVLMSMVFLAVSLTVASNIGVDPELESGPFKIIEYVTAAFFFVEVTTRLICMGAGPFFKSNFCRIDFICTSIDLVALVFELSIGASDSSSKDDTAAMEYAPAFRTLRILRFVRLIRVLRMARYVGQIQKVFSDNLETDKEGLCLTRYGLRRLTKLFSGVEGEALDLDKMSKTPIVTVCLDLLIYENPDLFEAAFLTLSRHFSQVTEFLQAMQDVQLLATPQAQRAYDTLRNELSVFRNNIESYEMWGCENDFTEVNKVTIEQVLSTLKKLRSMCETDEEDGVSADNQNLLRKMNVHDIIVGKTGVFSIDFSEEQVHAGHLLDIKQLSVLFLQKFVRDNKENREVLFPHIGMLRQQMDHGICGVPMLLSNLFRGTRKLCEELSQEDVWAFGSIIDESIKDGNYDWSLLDFFEIICVPRGNPIKEKQELVLRVLTSPQLPNITKLFTEGMDRNRMDNVENSRGYKTRRALMEECGDLVEVRPEEAEVGSSSQQLRYHIELLDLMFTCCRGEIAVCEAKCQKLLPLDLCLTVLLDPATIDRVKVIFSKFVFEVFLETEFVDLGQIEANFMLWEYFEECTQVIGQYIEQLRSRGKRAIVSGQLEEYLQEGIFPLISAFFSHVGRVAFEVDAMQTVVDNLKDDMLALLAVRKLLPTKMRLAAHGCAVALQVVRDVNIDDTSGRRDSVSVKPDQTAGAVHDLVEFVDVMVCSKALQERVQSDFDKLVQVVLDVETLTDKKEEEYEILQMALDKRAMADIRTSSITFEMLCKRMIQHCRDMIRKNSKSHVISVTVLRVLQRCVTMLEGPCTANMDDVSDSAEEDRKKAERIWHDRQSELTQYGAAKLVVDIVASHAPDEMVVEALKLGTVLLKGGNHDVQMDFYNYLHQDRTESFFQKLQQRIRRQIDAHKASRRLRKLAARSSAMSSSSMLLSELTENEEPDAIQIQFLVHLLQELCEGHNLLMQDLLRDQVATTHNRFSYNLVEEAVALLEVLCKKEPRIASMDLNEADQVLSILDLLIEVMQGPCVKNQNFLVDSFMVNACKNLLSNAWQTRHLDGKERIARETTRQRCSGDSDDETMIPVTKRLKSGAMKALISLLEGRSDLKVHTILAEKLETILLRLRMVQIYQEFNQYQTQQAHAMGAGWDELFLEEACDLLTIITVIGNTDTRFCEEMKPTMTPEPVEIRFKDKHEYQQALTAFEEKRNYAEAFHFFGNKLRSVEIVWKDHLEKILFLVPSECEHFTENAKEHIKKIIKFADDDKMQVFVSHAQDLYEQMLHVEYLMQSRVCGIQVYAYIGQHIPLLKRLSFFLAMLMNVIMLISLETSSGFNTKPIFVSDLLGTGTSGGMYWLMVAFGILQFVLSCMVVAFMLVNRVPLVYKKMMRQRRQHKRAMVDHTTTVEEITKDIAELSVHFRTVIVLAGLLFTFFCVFIARYGFKGTFLPSFFYPFSAIAMSFKMCQGVRRYLGRPQSSLALVFCVMYDVLADAENMFYLTYLAASAIALFANLPFFYCYHLLDVVVMSEVLKNVVRAVTNSTKQLSMTSLLGVFAIYIFSVVSFFFLQGTMQNEDRVNECQSLLLCFTMTLHYGLMMGGGVAEYMDTLGNTLMFELSGGKFVARFFFDLLFFVVVLILLLNIIFGIIIDQFGQLRDQQVANDHAQKNNCFVCNIDRSRFDHDGHKKGIANGFALHIKNQHNMWDYLYFLVYLRHKPATEYTGAESFLSRCITEESPEWIPIGKALELEDSEEDREATVQQTLESLQHALLHRHEEGRDLMHRIEMDQKSTMSELRVLRNEIDTKMRQLNKAVATKGSATTVGYPAALGTDSEQHREEAGAGAGGGEIH